MSAGRSAPTAAATSDSTAQCAPSRHCLSPPPCAAQWAGRWRTPPRNPCSTERGGRLPGWLATTGSTSARFGRRSQKRRSGASADTAPAKSNVFWPSSGRRTTVRLTPASPSPARPTSASVPGAPLLFFDPRGDSVARHTEGAGQSAQTAALVVGAQDRLALLVRVGIRARLLAAAASALAAQVALPPIGSQAVTHQVRTAAVLAL